jgi:hypothetical protein
MPNSTAECNRSGLISTLTSTSIPYLSQSIPPFLQAILDKSNINQLPPNKSSFLTTRTRSEAMEKYVGLVANETFKIIYKLIGTRSSKWFQDRAGEYWDGNYYYLSKQYFEDKYNSNKRKIISAELKCLFELGLIDRTQYYPGKCRAINSPGKCRGYQITDTDLIEAFEQPVTKEVEKIWVDLPCDKKKFIQSDIAKLADKNIPTGMMNLKAVCEYFDREFETASGYKLEHLLLELGYVLQLWIGKISYDKETSYLTYKQSYHTTLIGGRTYASSGDQFITKELKTAWFDLKDVFNYDFVACHVNLFNQINPTIFADNWVNNPEFKQSLADKISIPVGLLKQSVLAITYGGKPTANKICKIFQLFLEHFNDYKLAEYHLELFKIETLEYQTAIDKWQAEIRANPKAYQKNALGMRTDATDSKTLASHWLVGREQKAINLISSLANQRRGEYQVISDQFDGIVTIGKIPADLIQVLLDKFKLSLVEKPFN